MNWQIRRFPILASTNDLALEWIRANMAPAGTVLVAEQQTSGRGRPGRVWHSPRGALLTTVVLPFYPEHVGWTALAAGLAVCRTARELGVPAGVKWPNDVVVSGKKLAGVLVETSSPKLAAVGIGLNVHNPPPDDPELAARTARLADDCPGITVDAVLERLLPHLAQAWSQLAAGDLTSLRTSWSEMDTTAGRRVRWAHGNLAGTAEGVEADGSLRIRTDGAVPVVVSAGEVVFEI